MFYAREAFTKIVKAHPPTAIEAFEAIKRVLNDKKASNGFKEFAIYASREIVKAHPPIAIEAFEAITAIFKDPSDYCRYHYLSEDAERALHDIVVAMPAEIMVAIKGILNDKKASNGFKEVAISALSEIVKAHSPTATEAFEAIKGIMNDKKASGKLREFAIYALHEIVNALQTAAPEAFKIIKGIWWEHIEVAMYALPEIVKAHPSALVEAFSIIRSIVIQRYKNPFKYAAIEALSRIVKAHSSSAIEAFEAIKRVLNEEEASDDLKKVVMEALTEIIKAMPTATEVIAVIQGILKLNGRAASDELRELAIKAWPEIVKAHPPTALEAFKTINGILTKGWWHNESAASVLPEIVKAIPSGKAMAAIESILNEQEVSWKFNEAIIEPLLEIVKTMSFDKLASLLNYKTSLIREVATKAIYEKLNNKEEVKKLSDRHVITLLNIIEITRSDEEKKELNVVAKKALKYALINIDEVGIAWIIGHFGELSVFSEAKFFLKGIFYKILNEGIISEIAADFITKCIIENGFTVIIILSKVSIIIEGDVYTLREEDKGILEQIVKNVIDVSNDPLALQYKGLEPLFLNTGSALPIAALDIKDKAPPVSTIKDPNEVLVIRLVESIVDKMKEDLASKEDLVAVTSSVKGLIIDHQVTQQRIAMLKKLPKAEPQTKHKDGETVVMKVSMLNKVIYDNILLNYPELIQDVLEIDKANRTDSSDWQNNLPQPLNFNRILNLSTKIDQDLLLQAINDNNTNLLLAGLISLEPTYGDYYDSG